MPDVPTRTKNPKIARLTLGLFLLLPLAGCLGQAPIHQPLETAPAGHTATYLGQLEGRETRLTIVQASQSGYVIHVRHTADAFVEQGDYIYIVDADGMIKGVVALCPARTGATCAWGDYHQFETGLQGLPFLCGAMIPASGTYVRNGPDASVIETRQSQTNDGARQIATAIDGNQLFECTLSGPYPSAEIRSSSPPPGLSGLMKLTSGDAPFLPQLNRPGADALLAFSRNPTVFLPDSPDFSMMSTNEVLAVFNQRSSQFNRFMDANPSGVTPVINDFRIGGNATVGPMFGSVRKDVVTEQRYIREIVLYGIDSQNLFRGQVQGSEASTGDDQVWLPNASWTVVGEEAFIDDHHGFAFRDDDGHMWEGVHDLQRATAAARGIGFAEDALVSARYQPTWSDPWRAEVHSHDACIEGTDGRVSGDTFGILYSETVCISTATGGLTSAVGDWDLVRQAAHLENIDWRALVF